MVVKPRVLEELGETCRVKDLLAFRQYSPSAAAVHSTRKADLIAEFLSVFDDATTERVCSDVLASWSVHELRLFLARLRGLGFHVAMGPRPPAAGLDRCDHRRRGRPRIACARAFSSAARKQRQLQRACRSKEQGRMP